MKYKFSKEELYHSLPDYISGNISDTVLLENIRNEIENNPEFREEYTDLIETFNFLGSAQFESPSDSYFSNLPVKINSLLNQEPQKRRFITGLTDLKKLLIPSGIAVIAAAILYIIFYSGNNEVNYISDKSGIQITDSEKVKAESDIIKNENTDNKTVISGIENLQTNKQDEIKSDHEKFMNLYYKNRSAFSGQHKISFGENKSKIKNSKFDLDIIAYNIQHISNSELESDQEEDNLFIKESDDDNIINEDEMLKLTPEEENEILENLYKSQI